MAVSSVNKKPFDFWSMGLETAASTQNLDDDSDYRMVTVHNSGGLQPDAVVQQLAVEQHRPAVQQLTEKLLHSWDHFRGAATTKVALEGSSERVQVSGDEALAEEAKAQQLAAPKKG